MIAIAQAEGMPVKFPGSGGAVRATPALRHRPMRASDMRAVVMPAPVWFLRRSGGRHEPPRVPHACASCVPPHCGVQVVGMSQSEEERDAIKVLYENAGYVFTKLMPYEPAC